MYRCVYVYTHTLNIQTCDFWWIRIRIWPATKGPGDDRELIFGNLFWFLGPKALQDPPRRAQQPTQDLPRLPKTPPDPPQTLPKPHHHLGPKPSNPTHAHPVPI